MEPWYLLFLASFTFGGIASLVVPQSIFDEDLRE